MNARRFLSWATLMLGLAAGCDEAGPLDPGNPPGPGAPANPASFTAAPASTSSVTLTWSAVEGVSGYTLERRTGEGAFSQIASPTAAATQHMDDGLTAGTAYTYRIRAVGNGGTSSGREASATTQQPAAAPANPANFRASVFSMSSIGVEWQAVAGVSGYTLERRTDEGAFSQIANLASTVTLYRDEGLTPSTTYTYRIRAVGSGGSSTGVETSATTQRPAPGPDEREEYVVKGRVLDARGNPLVGVQVFARNTLYYNSNVIGVTDDQGWYRIDLPQHVGSYMTSAQLTRTYHGRSYRFRLHVDNNDPYAGSQGAVRNFEWRLTGDNHEGYKHGSTVYVYVAWWLDRDDVELTFTPDGPLVDGSPGEVLVRRATGGRIDDVAVGRYKVTARYLPPGEAPRAIKIRVRHTEDYLDETIAMFPGEPNNRPEMELEVYEQQR